MGESLDIQIGDYVRCDMPYNGQYWVRVDKLIDMHDQCYDVWTQGTPGFEGEVISVKQGEWIPVYGEELAFAFGDVLEVRRM